MVVSDGHGGSRYWLSHVGSALACATAQQVVAKHLQQTPLTAVERWLRLLQLDLPEAIQRSWLDVIEADWQKRTPLNQPFKSLTYGCTIGLVLLAPGWWGTTGVGDWDLAAVERSGASIILSQETISELELSEATESLCSAMDQHRWSGRAQLHRLDAYDPLQALILSTDGVRKSCATDDDYLQLCAGVAELHDMNEIHTGLAQISAEGSGDDVSLAIAVRNHRDPNPLY